MASLENSAVCKEVFADIKKFVKDRTSPAVTDVVRTLKEIGIHEDPRMILNMMNMIANSGGKKMG
ncbi:MAG: hypothetical protein ACD_62C00254G0002 [uncultured bacterium]|nr:MAG: hypothetical protein ACD_62C00254G0002 [uncultured bacterium]